MVKYVVLTVMSLLLIACSVQDEEYYRLHPQALQKAIKNCPERQSRQVDCAKLVSIASHVNELAYQLQSNPQAFGQKILALQEVVAKQELELQQKGNQPELKSLLNKNKRRLDARLAVVKWLQSPEI